MPDQPTGPECDPPATNPPVASRDINIGYTIIAAVIFNIGHLIIIIIWFFRKLKRRVFDYIKYGLPPEGTVGEGMNAVRLWRKDDSDNDCS